MVRGLEFVLGEVERFRFDFFVGEVGYLLEEGEGTLF